MFKISLATVTYAGFAGWLSDVIAHWMPGFSLDKAQTTGFVVAVTGVVFGVAWNWLQGWQQHERLVAEGKAAATIPLPNTSAPLSPSTGARGTLRCLL